MLHALLTRIGRLCYLVGNAHMGYVPGFRYDLFLSYASEDNADGWVEKFQEHLTGELARLLGRPFGDKTVYFDRLRLRVGQQYPDELDIAARDSALLVALLSPGYASSSWCSRERNEFQERLPEGAVFSECLAAVRLRPIDQLPAVLSNAQRADFAIAGFQEPWPAGSVKWLEIAHRLAAEIKEALQKLRSRCGSVFAGTTLRSDMDLRVRVVDYLAEQHFRAVPHPEVRLDDPVARQGALTEAKCAVHFLGGATDAALEALEESTQLCKGPTIVFRPFGAKLSEGEGLFLEGLPRERYQEFDSNEIELKKFLQGLLTRTREAAAQKPASISLICEPADFPWAQQFTAPGLSVEYPRFLQEKLTNTERLRRLRQMVREGHGLLFYQGRSEERLLASIWQLAEEVKSQAARRWYLDQPELEAKREKHPERPRYPEGLDAFLDEVRRRAGSS